MDFFAWRGKKSRDGSNTEKDTQHLTQVWTYEYKGKKGTNTFRFTRTL